MPGTETMPRLVPGAPPPPTISKSQQKKKRKSAKPGGELSTPSTPVVVLSTLDAALTEKAPGENDVQQGALAPDLVAPSQSLEPQTPADNWKTTPIIQLLNKRQRVLQKKIGRVKGYEASDPATLNEDQKQTLKTLSALEAVYKEVEDVKKAIEAHESELAVQTNAHREEAEREERARMAAAVAAAEAAFAKKAADLVVFSHLRSFLSAGHPNALALNLNDQEGSAVFALTDLLVGEGEDKVAAVNSFLTGHGEFQGVPYTRLQEIAELYLNPPAAPAPQETEEQVLEEVVEALVEAATAEPTVIGVPGGVTAKGSFSFMQDSELDTPDFEENAEWVEKADAEDGDIHATIEQTTITEVVVNGEVVEETVEIEKADIEVSGTNESIDWADEDGGLPSIAEVQASFGTPEAGTPAPEPETPVINGGPHHEEDDGFVHPRGRGRPRGGPRGERGGRGGGFRGDRGGRGEFRGGYRGGRGEFGGHRGDRGDFSGHRGDRGDFGGHRGDRGDFGHRGDRGDFGHRGDRGSFRGESRGRGGDRGGYRGRGDGDWRGGGDGEFRGRGRGGRGRGDRGGLHGHSDSRGGGAQA